MLKLRRQGIFFLHIPAFMILAVCLAPGSTSGQDEAQDDGLVDVFYELSASEGEGIHLESLVKLLQREEKTQIILKQAEFPDENKIVFYGDGKIQEGEPFFQFVQLMLRNANYAIVNSEIQGNLPTLEIVPMANVRPRVPNRRVREGEDLTDGLRIGEYVTAVFSLKYISPADAETHLKEFILRPESGTTQSDGNTNDVILKMPPNLLIVTEMASRINRIRDSIDIIDVPQARIETVFREVVHLEARSLEEQLKSIIQQQDTAEGNALNNDATDKQLSPAMRDFQNIQISSDERTNRLILVGTKSAVERVINLVKQLDTSLDMKVRTFQFNHVSADRIDALVRQSLPYDSTRIDRLYQSTPVESSNSLIVTARADILDRIEQIREQLDVQGSNLNSSGAANPVVVYKLKHVKAEDLRATLQKVVRQYQPDFQGPNDRSGGVRGINIETGIRSRTGLQPNGVNALDPNREGQFQPQRFLRDDPDPQSRRSGGLPNGAFNPLDPSFAQLLDNTQLSTENVLPGEARVTVNESTNSLIVIAEPPIQRLYRELILQLDVYRPSVLVEVTVVTLDAQEEFNLGVEVSGGDRIGGKRLFSFNSFGLSTIDPVSGGLSIAPGLGFNGTLVDPEVADVVLRALSRHRRARVMSAPRILVNDNATGVLSSVAEVPFQSINANNTISTTSFAGFATAGTTISVTPQISEGDYLNLEFDVLVNDFTGTGNEALPPPRNTDQVTSEVSIPDGHTVIVGGLTRQRNSTDEQRIPFLEDIPVFEFLTGSTSHGEREQRLFVFIKPIILRDDKFRDLRYLSEIEHREACVPGDFPQSRPLLIR